MQKGAIRVIITWDIEMKRGGERESSRGGRKKNGHTFTVNRKLATGEGRKEKGKDKSAVAIQ